MALKDGVITTFFNLIGLRPPQRPKGRVIITKGDVSFEWRLDRREHNWLYISQYSEETGKIEETVIHAGDPAVQIIE